MAPTTTPRSFGYRMADPLPQTHRRFDRRFVSFLPLSILLFQFITDPARGSEAYFSPDGGIRDQLIRRIEHSRRTIDIAVYSFTSIQLAQALIDARRRGVRIRIIRDRGQSRNRHDEDRFLEQNNIAIKVMPGLPPHGVMHHKFAIFDQDVLETGSFNWTLNGEKYSHENALFFDDPKMIQAFEREFQKLWTTRL